MAKLRLNQRQITKARLLAREITSPLQAEISGHTTVAIERASLRLLGLTGSVVGSDQHPLPKVNLLVDRVLEAGVLQHGVLYVLAALMERSGETLAEVADGVVHGRLAVPHAVNGGHFRSQACQELTKRSQKAVEDLRARARRKRKRQGKLLGREEPLRYVIVATGNIHEDVIQAQAAAQNGADIIAVIRSTAQSLLDFVPVGITTQGFGGTFATQENFRLMRQALDETSTKLKRYIHLTNYSSGLCMPEIAAIAALEDLDMLLNDAMYGILFRDINMRRTFTDQYFSRLICAANGIYIQTGEDNYLTTADAFASAHHVLASQLINESFAKRAGLSEDHMCLGHAFEMNPALTDGFLWEVAQAQMIRQIFPRAPLKYMPPTKHKSGDFFWSHLYDGMFNLATLLTDQTISLLGMATEALHNPKMQDRYWSLKNANYIFNNARHLRDEIQYKPGGRMERRVEKVLADTLRLLKKVKKVGLMAAISKGWFADVKRHPLGGKGLQGVVEKSSQYWNPIWNALKKSHR